MLLSERRAPLDCTANDAEKNLETLNEVIFASQRDDGVSEISRDN